MRGSGGPWPPLFDEIFNVEQAVVAGGLEVFGELGSGDSVWSDCFGPDGPDRGNPGKIGVGMPFVGEVVPMAWADGGLDLMARFEREECGVADEDGSVCVFEHGDGVCRRGDEGGVRVEKFAEEDFGVGERAARGGVGGDGLYCVERVRRFDDELDGADFV